VFINATNTVGIDANRMLQYGTGQHLLQFICGLGPRKAAGLLSSLRKKGGQLVSRRDLVSNRHLSKVVFINAAGFIRISPDYLDHPDMDVLDDTRIHPESYSIAIKMASDALDVRGDERTMQQSVDKIMKDASPLEQIDLDLFAEQLQAAGAGMKRLTLDFIKEELRAPFRELRPPYTSLTPEQLFELMTGESDATLRKGVIVPVRVIRLLDKGANVKLDNGLPGYIPISQVSDSHVMDLSERLEVGQTIMARVTEVKKDDLKRFGVSLSCKSSYDCVCIGLYILMYARDLVDTEFRFVKERLETTDRFNKIEGFLEKRSDGVQYQNILFLMLTYTSNNRATSKSVYKSYYITSTFPKHHIKRSIEKARA